MSRVGETARLVLRRFTPGDYEALRELNSSAKVMRYINGGIPETPDQTRASLERAMGYYAKGDALGVWAAELKETGEFIGWLALKPLPDGSDIELGYRLLERHWGRGYASEGAAWLRDRAFGLAALTRVTAIVDPGNAASRRIIEKTGLRFEKSTTMVFGGSNAPRAVDLFSAEA